jgi:hypothetical protein
MVCVGTFAIRHQMNKSPLKKFVLGLFSPNTLLNASMRLSAEMSFLTG